MTPPNGLDYKTSREAFISRMIGIPWANRACSFDAADCWGLVVLFYRHVLGLDIHHTADYEAGKEFVTCFDGDVVFWSSVDHPVDNGIFVGYIGSHPAHVGIVIGDSAFHSRGECGSVKVDTLRAIERKFTRVEFYKYASD